MPKGVFTIQATGRTWKGLLVICFFLVVLAFPVMCCESMLVTDLADIPAEGEESGGFAGLMVGFASVLYIVSKAGAWWFHG